MRASRADLIRTKPLPSASRNIKTYHPASFFKSPRGPGALSICTGGNDFLAQKILRSHNEREKRKTLQGQTESEAEPYYGTGGTDSPTFLIANAHTVTRKLATKKNPRTCELSAIEQAQLD